MDLPDVPTSTLILDPSAVVSSPFAERTTLGNLYGTLTASSAPSTNQNSSSGLSTAGLIALGLGLLAMLLALSLVAGLFLWRQKKRLQGGTSRTAQRISHASTMDWTIVEEPGVIQTRSTVLFSVPSLRQNPVLLNSTIFSPRAGSSGSGDDLRSEEELAFERNLRSPLRISGATTPRTPQTPDSEDPESPVDPKRKRQSAVFGFPRPPSRGGTSSEAGSSSPVLSTSRGYFM